MALPDAQGAVTAQEADSFLIQLSSNMYNPMLPRPEHPRPQFERDSWINLNGEWSYTFDFGGSGRDAGRELFKSKGFDRTILVPFCPESKLSGVGYTDFIEDMWYHRKITVPTAWAGRRAILHFGAVDYEAEVFIDGVSLGTHFGGTVSFEFDITSYVTPGEEHDLVVRVHDSTREAGQPGGKQCPDYKSRGCHYTRTTGIWQTVWLEPVPEPYIRALSVTSGPDWFSVSADGVSEGTVCFGGARWPLDTRIPVPDPQLWSPEQPTLYPFSVQSGDDAVESYFALRTLTADTVGGVPRLLLNGRPYFFHALLDQGYWSDGLLTAPSDEALIYDIELAKSMGFNMLRKHMKIEPLRWYYHCDRLGMLVWQDMPAGGTSRNPLIVSLPLFTGIQLRDNRYGLFGRRSAEGRTQFYRELHEMVAALFNCPCVAMWVPFNEVWGQFDSAKVCAGILSMDTSRFIDHASGWHDQGIGFVRSLHVYGRSFRMKDVPSSRAIVLSEFGGYTLRIDGHCRPGRAFGYRRFDSANSYKYALLDLYKHQILPAHSEGLSASVYTQLSDVEDELNGLVTYDRRVVKLSPKLMCGIVKIY